jgi:phenylacetate-CoA ligase
MPGIRFKIIGRTDDMLIVRGVNVYPQAIAGVIARFRPQLTGAFRIRLDRPGPVVRHPLRLRVEHAGLEPDALARLEQQLTQAFRERLRIRPAFEWLAPGAIPRETGKTRLVEVTPP